MDMVSKNKIGFRYLFECYRTDGSVKWISEESNLIPDQGRDYIMSAALNGGAQLSAWYIGLYSGNYAPVVGDTMALFPAAATEITTAYSEATRQALSASALSAGVWANTAVPAQFTFTATSTTVTGGFISSAATQNGTTGVLLSAVLASSPKTVLAGEILKVTCGLSLVTA